MPNESPGRARRQLRGVLTLLGRLLELALNPEASPAAPEPAPQIGAEIEFYPAS